MAIAPTDAATAMSGGVVLARRRGKSKGPNFKYDGPVSVIRLELDVSNPAVLRRLERQWEAAFRLRRALQRDAQHRCRAYSAAHRERAADPKALRDRLGLSRKGFEAVAKSHIEASGWMRDHLTKAIGLHMADEVWQTVVRYLFPDASGRRHGPPKVGSWWQFTRIPGRARSHTKTTPVWETYRLVGTLDGHLKAWRHRQLPAAVTGRARRRPPSRLGSRFWPSPPSLPPQGGLPRVSGPITAVRWRWCSPACPVGTWCCRCGCPRVRASGRGWVISWATRGCGTRSTWCGCAIARPLAVGGITRTC